MWNILDWRDDINRISKASRNYFGEVNVLHILTDIDSFSVMKRIRDIVRNYGQ